MDCSLFVQREAVLWVELRLRLEKIRKLQHSWELLMRVSYLLQIGLCIQVKKAAETIRSSDYGRMRDHTDQQFS